jgi:hypothetical protein
MADFICMFIPVYCAISPIFIPFSISYQTSLNK